MKDRLPAFIALFILIGLVLTTWWAADYAQRAIPIDPPAKISHEPDAWSGQFTMITSNPAGQAINRVQGQALRHYPDDDSYQVDLANVIGQHPDNPRTTGVAKLATITDNGNHILLQGDAHLHRYPTEKDAALDVQSQELVILPKQDIVKTDKPTEVIQGKSHMKGSGMLYNNATRRLEVFRNSDVSIAPEDIERAKNNKGSTE